MTIGRGRSSLLCDFAYEESELKIVEGYDRGWIMMGAICLPGCVHLVLGPPFCLSNLLGDSFRRGFLLVPELDDFVSFDGILGLSEIKVGGEDRSQERPKSDNHGGHEQLVGGIEVGYQI